MFMSPIDDMVRAHQIQYYQYADDLMLYTALTPSRFSDLSSIADCTDAVSTWFMHAERSAAKHWQDGGCDLWNAATFG